MTKGDSTKWDKSEQNQEKIMDLVDEWDGKDEEIKLELLLSIVVQYPESMMSNSILIKK